MTTHDLPFRIEHRGVERLNGQDVHKREVTGDAEVFEVRGPRGLTVLVRDVRWDSGSRDVALHDRLDAPMRFDRLANGLRMAVNGGAKQIWFDLRQARTKDTGRSNLFDATEQELTAGAGHDIRAALLAVGADQIATRETVLGDDGPRRRKLCVSAPVTAALVPIMGYALTRLAPIDREIAA